MWACGFLIHICLEFFQSLAVLDCASPLTTKNEDRGRLLRKITCPRPQDFGDLLIASLEVSSPKHHGSVLQVPACGNKA